MAALPRPQILASAIFAGSDMPLGAEYGKKRKMLGSITGRTFETIVLLAFATHKIKMLRLPHSFSTRNFFDLFLAADPTGTDYPVKMVRNFEASVFNPLEYGLTTYAKSLCGLALTQAHLETGPYGP